ncbi:hypothetical protein ACFUC1_04485 [Pedococcus sp. NPDC057267]|uniref:hypothetical protein n=1 Tax=Pedococcus sp. NPDC057267 TaxID=3346077 RepID=UPI00362CD417
MSTTAPEYLTTLRTGLAEAVQQWADQSTSAWEQWTRAWQPVADAGADALGVPRLQPGSPPRVVTAAGAAARHDHGHHDHGHGVHPGHGHHHDHHGWEQRAGHRHEGCGCGEPQGHAEPHGHVEAYRHEGCGCAECRGHAEAHRHEGCGCGGHGRGCACGGREHAHGCCAGPCDCCVPEADVVVRARAGEVRVVPFRLHNPWRREREVTLEVGPWHACGGDALEVRARLEDTSLTLAPCEDRVVRLLVTATGSKAAGDTTTEHPGKPGQADPAQDERVRAAGDVGEEAVRQVSVLRGADVGSCSTAYADVRFEGCARPQRVALVVLPAECDPVDVGCGCGCCCEEHR